MTRRRVSWRNLHRSAAKRTDLWFTATEIASAGWPGCPKSAQQVRRWARAEGWTSRKGGSLVRHRNSPHRPIEYHVSLLPTGFIDRILNGEPGPDPVFVAYFTARDALKDLTLSQRRRVLTNLLDVELMTLETRFQEATAAG